MAPEAARHRLEAHQLNSLARRPEPETGERLLRTGSRALLEGTMQWTGAADPIPRSRWASRSRKRISTVWRAWSKLIRSFSKWSIAFPRFGARSLPSTQARRPWRRRGYAIVADETIEGLGTRYVTLSTPAGRSLKRALTELRRIDRHSEFAVNHVHVQSGVAMGAHSPAVALAASSAIQGSAIGIIDGGVGKTAILPQLTQQGFAQGAPAPNAHATAVASLAAGIRPVRSGAPGAPLLIADIYGTDPRGGNSLALARALGWMATRKAPVVLISLVGPPNPIVASAIRQVRARGMHVVAPVGNAGPAAPPMFPASYPGVIAVTGVDGKNRALIEAGRGPHVDYAAPGAEIFAASLDGRLVKVRGTSFAAPFVAGRLWLAARSGDPILVLDRQAVAIGRKGEDRIFGRGLICGECR